jgi:hypothetical protein
MATSSFVSSTRSVLSVLSRSNRAFRTSESLLDARFASATCLFITVSTALSKSARYPALSSVAVLSSHKVAKGILVPGECGRASASDFEV